MKCNPFYIYMDLRYISSIAIHNLRGNRISRLFHLDKGYLFSVFFESSDSNLRATYVRAPKIDKTSEFPLPRISERNYFICSTIIPSVLTSTDKWLSLNSLQQIYETINLCTSQDRSLIFLLLYEILK